MKLLLVDDHQIVIEGLSALLTGRGHTVAYTASSLDEAIKFKEADWDLAVLDLYLSKEHGLDLLREIRATGNLKPVLIFSMGLEAAWAPRVLKAGAQGFVHKGENIEHLLQAIDNLAYGQNYISKYQEELVFDRYVRATKTKRKSDLSQREEEVLGYLAQGLTPKQIREKLNLSAHTVSTFRTRMMKKLKITTTAELLRYALIRFSKDLPLN